MTRSGKGKIIIPTGVRPWPHELRVAEILALAGYLVEFIPKGPNRTADVLLNGVEYEIKSPLTDKANTWEHTIKRALRQSQNLIMDSSRTNGRKIRDDQICKFLVNKARRHPQIKRMIFITRQGQIIDIKALVW